MLSDNNERRTRPKQFYGFTTITCTSLLVERLGVGGGGSDVGIAGSLVGAGLLLEGLGGSKVGATGGLVGLLVVTSGLDEVGDGGGGESSEHCCEKILVLLVSVNHFLFASLLEPPLHGSAPLSKRPPRHHPTCRVGLRRDKMKKQMMVATLRCYTQVEPKFCM